MSTTFEKAYLSIQAPAANGAAATGPGGGMSGNRIAFKFNPKEITIDKKANWKSEPAKGAKKAPRPEFTGTDPKSMKIEMFLDESESESGSVLGDVEKLFDCLGPEPSTASGTKPTPPTVILGWGSQTYFEAYIESVSAKFMKFRTDGTPVRAVVNLSLKQIPPAAARTNPTSGGTMHARRFHVMQAGDSLASVAYREYQDPSYWRAIAEANDVEDPMRIALGTHLLVPPADEAAAYL